MLSAAGIDARRAHAPGAIAAGVGLAVAVAFSSTRIVAAPGFEFYLGPLFYLLAYRWFGLPAGLLAATATMAPSILWWGHPVSVLLAVGHVLAVDRFARRGYSLATITFLYQASVGAAASLTLVAYHYSAPIEIVLVILLRKLLCEVMLATIVDIVTLLVRLDRATGRLVRCRTLRLQGSLDAIVSLAVAGAATLFLLGELHHIHDRLALRETEVAQAVRVATRGGAEPTVLRMPGIEQPLPMVVAPAGGIAAAAARIGCKRLDQGESGPDDRRTFTYWLDMCVVAPAGPGRVAAVSPRPHVRALFGEVVRGLLPLLAYLVLAQIALLAFRTAIRRSLDLWDQALRGLARQEPLELPHAPFQETDALLRAFVASNNVYIAAERERVRLSRAVDELRSTIELKLFSDVSFDADACALSFTKISPEFGRMQMRVPVHHADRSFFLSLRGKDDIMVEFRRGNETDDNWYLLLAHEYDPATGCWRYGCMIRLRAAKIFQSQMRHNARLIELGGMASALSHELRQPLFTISLAAENGSLMLDPTAPGSAAIAQKFDRIIEQVERASAIVQRTSTYARAERDERAPTDLGQAVHDAVRFMRPVLTERGIHLHTELPADLPALLLPRIGVEQIVVNALQNAADSIDAAREQGGATHGTVTIAITADADMIALSIGDNGAGLSPEVGANAFDAFCTSKPAGKGTGLGLFVCRQIMDEVSGSITLANNPDAPGATLTLIFPKQ